jgi:hypothetical protein
MTSKNTIEPSKQTLPDIENTSIGILLNSLAANGVIVEAERFTQLYLTEINIAYNDGQLAALSSLAK